MPRHKSLKDLALEAVARMVQQRVIHPVTGPKRALAENTLLSALAEGLQEREAALTATRIAMEALRPFADRICTFPSTSSLSVGVSAEERRLATEALLLVRRAYSHNVGVELLEALRTAVKALEITAPEQL